MKGCLTLILGFILGAVAMFLLFSVSMPKIGVEAIEQSIEVKSKSLKGLVLFEQVGDCVGSGTYRIKEVLDENYAIAEEVEYDTVLENYYTRYNGIKVVIKSEEKNKYFDEQIIKMPAGKCMRQIGVYTKYSNTYPVVKISK